MDELYTKHCIVVCTTCTAAAYVGCRPTPHLAVCSFICHVASTRKQWSDLLQSSIQAISWLLAV